MERLTKRDNSGRATFSGDGSPVENVNKIPAILDRLAAYEDTGLEPDELTTVRALCEDYVSAGLDVGFIRACINAAQSGMSAERITDITKAEAEVRLLLPPCKVGDTVYRIENYPNGKKTIPAYPKYTVYAYSVFPAFGEEDGITIFARKLNQDGTPMSSYEVFKSPAFGKTVFLTREEAEAALKQEVETDD